jgi:hypothetical protein
MTPGEVSARGRTTVPPRGGPPGRVLRQSRGDILQRVLAVLFIGAWFTCGLVEPVPDGPEPEYHLWMLPVDVASLGTIIAASVLLWRGSRMAARVGIAAGVLMCVETALCPGTGHHLMGTFLWVQTALSVFVPLTSAALPRLGLPVGRRRLR